MASPTGSAATRAANTPTLRMPAPGDVPRGREQRARRLIAPDRPVVPSPNEAEAMRDTGSRELGRERGVLGAERIGGARVGPDVGLRLAQGDRGLRQGYQ